MPYEHRRSTYHLLPDSHGEGWYVEKESVGGAKERWAAATKEVAVEHASMLAKEHRPSAVEIHDGKGASERILFDAEGG